MAPMLVNAVSTDPYSIAASKNTSQSSNFSYQQVDTQVSVLTPLAQFSMSSHITDLTLSDDKTSFAYYKSDNSMAMRAESQTQVHLHEETSNFDITYSAEALGLKSKDFANGKPMVLKFSFQQKELSYQSVMSAQVVNQIRDPQDVLSDLAKALRDVLRNDGNKSVMYVLDDEARKSLLSDPKILKLANELILLMASINLAKRQGNANNYTIYVSGKAKPRVDKNEKTDIDSKTNTINVTITINPPGGQNKPVSTPTPAQDISQNQPANINLTV